MQQLVHQGVIPQRRIIDEFRVKEDHNLARTHSKSSTALEFIVVHLEPSYSHSPLPGIFVQHLKSARQIWQERRDICIKKFDDRRPKMLGDALGCLGHVL